MNMIQGADIFRIAWCYRIKGGHKADQSRGIDPHVLINSLQIFNRHSFIPHILTDI